MLRTLSRLLSGVWRSPSSPKLCPPSSSAGVPATEEEGVGPTDPLKRDEQLPGADRVVAPVPPEV